MTSRFCSSSFINVLSQDRLPFGDPFYYRTKSAPTTGYNRRVMHKQRNMHDRVEKALDKVRPALRADGGDARVVACDEETGSVSIQMLGACKGCPLSQLDFVYAIESLIRREVPDVREIIAV
jgi:Fe-S cluster biogenesis protein NfuA